jgi:hypothetical protein
VEHNNNSDEEEDFEEEGEPEVPVWVNIIIHLHKTII